MVSLSALVPLASQRFPRLSRRVLASSGYTLDLSKYGSPDSFSVWTDKTAARQDKAWQPIVAEAKAGRPRDDVAALFAVLREIPARPLSLLEAGCGGGYNSELIESQFSGISYTGIDIAESMIVLAKQHYPERQFSVGSAYELDFGPASFSVVMDGVALLHMPKWRTSLAEYARVARSYVVLHGLTLTETATTTPFAKFAYGQPSLEFVFNRQEILSACTDVGLELVSIHPGSDYDLLPYLGIASTSETWLLKRSERN